MRDVLSFSRTRLPNFLIIACTAIWVCTIPAQGETFFQDGQGYWWDFAADGSVADGRGPTQAADSVDAFDSAMRLSVNGVMFPDSAQSTAMGGQMLVTGPALLSGLNVTRRAYVSNDPAAGWACFLEYFENPSDDTIGVTVRVVGNLGSDGATTVTGTSSGDTVFAPADQWLTSNDDGDNHDPNLSFNYWGAGAAVVPDEVFFPASQEDYYVQFPGVVIQPHATVILMHFCGQNADTASAIAKAEYLLGLPEACLAGLNAANYGPVLNWNIADALDVTPYALAASEGQQTGPFLPAAHEYTLTNTSDTPLDWSATGPAWLTLTPSSGTALAGGADETVSAAINALAGGYSPGVYTDAITFTNLTSGAQIVRNVKLTIREVLEVTPTSSYHLEGFQGGPFSPANRTYTLHNGGVDPLEWSSAAPAWLEISPNAGTINTGQSVEITVSPSTAAEALSPGTYAEPIVFENDSFGTSQHFPANILVKERLGFDPQARFVSRGLQGGPFAPSAATYVLRNLSDTESIAWSTLPGDAPAWISITPDSGTLAPLSSVTLEAAVNTAANGLAVGDYPDIISMHNNTYGTVLSQDVLLRVKDVVYVDMNAAGPAHDGASWGSAFLSLQEGIDAAAPAKSWVWVADGTYAETLVMAEGVELYGGFDGAPTLETAMAQRDPAANETIIDAGGAGSAVRFDGVAETGLDGFTILHGAATGTYPENCGGGIRCNATGDSVFIQQCVIRNNTAAMRGAGIYCMEGAAPAISDCLIAGNETDVDFGGGIACINSTPRIQNSKICNNHGRYGGGIGCIQCSPAIVNCVITGNIASSANGGAGGGGIFAHDHSSPLISNCVISGNIARDWGGGALFCQTASNAMLTNCTISGNACNTGSGGIEAIAGSATHPGSNIVLINCVLEQTSAYALWLDDRSQALIANCLFHGNAGADFSISGGGVLFGGDEINANVAGAHDNVAGNPEPRWKTGIEGVWSAVAYDALTNTTLLTAAGSAWSPGALIGQIIHPDMSQPRQALILDNSGDTVIVAGDITSATGLLGCANAGDSFETILYEVNADSPCINVGDNAAPNLPALDLAGNARIMQGIVDLGAYESASVASASVLDVKHEGEAAAGGSVLCFEVLFSRAVEEVDAADFVVDGLEGQESATIESVTGHDYRWRVCVNTGAANGALAVDLVDDDHSITDILGLPLDAGYDSDPLGPSAYYVDHLTIITPPEGGHKYIGESHVFTLQATGGTGTLHYAWMHNEASIPDAFDLPELSLEDLQTGDSGAYTCTVSDDYITVTSVAVTLTVSHKMPLSNALGLCTTAALISVVAVRVLRKRQKQAVLSN